jgi:hypothetical protein
MWHTTGNLTDLCVLSLCSGLVSNLTHQSQIRHARHKYVTYNSELKMACRPVTRDNMVAQRLDPQIHYENAEACIAVIAIKEQCAL